jgi:hypothetical protein
MLKNLLDNEQNKYKCPFEWIQNIGVFVKLCFVTSNGYNIKSSKVNPCAWCIVCDLQLTE